MIKITRVISIILASLILVSGAYAQNDGGNRQRGQNQRQGNRQPVDVEQWKAQQAQQIKAKTYKFMELMGEDVAEEKKQALGQIVQDHLVEEFKLRMAMLTARQKAGGDRQAMRSTMMAVRDKTEKLTSETKKKAKTLLDNNKAYKAFQKALAEVAPPQQQQRGGPGGGGRGGPGGQGGGRGGQGGGSRG